MVRPAIHFVTPVWGDVHVGHFLKTALPSFLAPGNLGSCGSGDRYTIVTLGESDAAKIRASEGFRRAQECLPTEVCLLPLSVQDQVGRAQESCPGNLPYALASACYAHTVQAAKAAGAGLMYLEPDAVFADGSFRSVRSRLAEGVKVIMVAAYRVWSPTFLPALEAMESDAPVLAIPPRILVGLSLGHIHPMSKAHFWEAPHYLNTTPGSLFWDVPGEGILARVFHQNPQVIIHPPDAPPFPITGGIDTNGYVEHVIQKPSDCHVVDDSDELFYVALEGPRPVYAFGPANPIPVVSYLLRACYPHHFRNAITNIRWHWREFSASHAWGETTTKAEEVIQRLLALKEVFSGMPDMERALIRFVLDSFDTQFEFRKAIDDLSADADAWFRLGALYHRSGRQDEALGYWKTALIRDSRHIATLTELVNHHVQLGDPALALGSLATLNALVPDHAQSLRSELMDGLSARGFKDLQDCLEKDDAPLVVLVAERPNSRVAKIAQALAFAGWRTVLLHRDPLHVADAACFPVALRFSDPYHALSLARMFNPAVYHLFSLNVDATCKAFLAQRPGKIIFDPYDTLDGIAYEWAQLTKDAQRACMEGADGLCARDLRARWLARHQSYRYRNHLLFLDGCWGKPLPPAAQKDNIHVVAAGYILLEKAGQMEQNYLRVAHAFAQEGVHFHLYPHPMQRQGMEESFSDYFALAARTPYFHLHEPLPMDLMAQELSQYDFGIAFNGCFTFGEMPLDYSLEYCRHTSAARVFEYLDAGLPVLDNRNGFRFRYHLLSRHGAVLDASEDLLSNAHTRLGEALASGISMRARRARNAYSVRQSIFRLTDFYEQVANA